MEKKLEITVNGNKYAFGEKEGLKDTETLRETLHERIPGIDLKRNCNRGICGNCTVLLNGSPVNSCMVLTAACDGKEIITWEGLSESEHKLYDIFKEDPYFGKHASYVSVKGVAMICIALLRRKKDPDKKDFEDALRGTYGGCMDPDVVYQLVEQYFQKTGFAKEGEEERA